LGFRLCVEQRHQPARDHEGAAHAEQYSGGGLSAWFTIELRSMADLALVLGIIFSASPQQLKSEMGLLGLALRSKARQQPVDRRYGRGLWIGEHSQRLKHLLARRSPSTPQLVSARPERVHSRLCLKVKSVIEGRPDPR
jgi:hypothetical protein